MYQMCRVREIFCSFCPDEIEFVGFHRVLIVKKLPDYIVVFLQVISEFASLQSHIDNLVIVAAI